MPPLALTDTEFLAIANAAQALRAPDRDKFYAEVARELQGREIGDGAIVAAQRARAFRSARFVEIEGLQQVSLAGPRLHVHHAFARSSSVFWSLASTLANSFANLLVRSTLLLSSVCCTSQRNRSAKRRK